MNDAKKRKKMKKIGHAEQERVTLINHKRDSKALFSDFLSFQVFALWEILNFKMTSTVI